MKNFTRLGAFIPMLTFLCLLLLLLPRSIRAAYLPEGPHPRIILTSEELSHLVAKRAANMSEWVNLIAWCDSHLSDTGYDVQPTTIGYGGLIAYGLANWDGKSYFGYRMSGFGEHLKNYALAYQVLKQPGNGQDLMKAQAYAAKVRTLLVDGIAKGLNVGEEANGLRAIRVSDSADVSINSAEVTALAATTESLPGQVSIINYKLGYSSRFLAAVPIAYDWIHETLSQQDKELLSAMMLRWYDWIQGVRSKYNNGVLINGIRYYEDYGGSADSTKINPPAGRIVTASDFGFMHSNFGSGHEALMSLIPVALYGDNADVPGYFTQTRTRFASVVDQLENPLKHSGGESVEGWNYGGGYQYLLPSLYGFYTATGDPLIGEMNWPSGLVDAMVHRVGANLLDVPYYGYWTGTPIGVNRLTFAIPFVGVSQRMSSASVLSGVGQHLLKNVAWAESGSLFDKTLWYRPDAAVIAPSVLPLSYLAQGSGIVTSRSNWMDPKTVHLLAILRGIAAQANHEGYSQGHFAVARGTDRLLSHSNSAGDSPPAVSFNTIVFNNANSQAKNPPLVSPAIDRIEEGSGYFFVSADITNAYKRPYKPDAALLFRRSILHIRPDIVVVSDVTRSNPALGNLKSWYTQYTSLPTTSADTISAITGTSKVYVKTLFPTGGSYTVTNPYPGSYRVMYTPVMSREYDQFLHVIQATGDQSAQSLATMINSSANVHATLIKSAGKNAIVLYPAAIDGGDINGTVTYTYTPATIATDHYILKAPPGQAYSISVTGAATKTVTLTPEPSSIMSSPNGVLVYSINSDNTFTQVKTTLDNTVLPPSRVRGRKL